MKRSDMEMAILRALAELDVKYPDGYGYEEQAAHVLKRIEEAGMLPPFDRKLDPWGEKGMSISLCKWEPEDET